VLFSLSERRFRQKSNEPARALTRLRRRSVGAGEMNGKSCWAGRGWMAAVMILFVAGLLLLLYK
jgi:hypothetical protein